MVHSGEAPNWQRLEKSKRRLLPKEDCQWSLIAFIMTRDVLYRHSHWHRLRWQIFWGLVAASLPTMTWALFLGINSQGLDSLFNASWGGLVAVLLGIFIIRNVGKYPGVENAAAIFPGFSVAFGALVALLLMLRLDYSRSVLAGAYLLAITIFYLGYAQVFARRRLTIGILPIDANDGLLQVKGVQLQRLHDLDQDVLHLEAIAVDLRKDLPTEWERRIADYALAGVPVYHSKHLIESLTGRVELEHLSETSFGTLSPPTAYMFFKHSVDRTTALLALLLLSPLLIIVALLIKLDSPGPAVFRQRRIGFRGKPFTVYKFRTMRDWQPADAGDRAAAITRENDNRITRLGRWLRRTRIDELPQIINVLKGQMSWIGPRPEADVLSSWYEEEIPFYRYRHIVRPGITGWAQVMQGHVADVDEVRSKLYYDFYYIKNFSLWIDSLIFFRTIITMVSGFGAK